MLWLTYAAFLCLVAAASFFFVYVFHFQALRLRPAGLDGARSAVSSQLQLAARISAIGARSWRRMRTRDVFLLEMKPQYSDGKLVINAFVGSGTPQNLTACAASGRYRRHISRVTSDSWDECFDCSAIWSKG
ncbi:hypothetical protein ISCGN_001717, partial [Ixodes scapularis]